MAKTEEISGFANLEELEDEDNEVVNVKKKVGKKSGGFQGMGLSQTVLNGILKRGYKIPTPIQRKVRKIIFVNNFNLLIFISNNKFFEFKSKGYQVSIFLNK